MKDQKPELRTTDSRWNGLYKMGGVAAMIITVLLVCEIIVFSVWRQPSTVMGYFALFQENWLVGLLDLDLLGMIAYFLFIPLMLAIYIALRQASESLMAIGTVLFFVGIAVFFSTNTAFSLLTLSNAYASAATEAQKAMFLAAGQALYTMFYVNQFQVSYVIISMAWLMIAIVMLRSNIFSQVNAYSGILAGASGIGAVALEHIPGIGDNLLVLVSIYFSAIVFLAIWVFLTGRRLFQIANESIN